MVLFGDMYHRPEAIQCRANATIIVAQRAISTLEKVKDMTHWLIAIAVAAGCDAYEAAINKANNENIPMMVMLGAKWCEPCQRMKKNELPKVKSLGKFAFAYIDVDEHEKLARQLAGEGAGLPQILTFWKTKDGWVRSRLNGFHNAKQLEQVFDAWLKQWQAAKEEME